MQSKAFKASIVLTILIVLALVGCIGKGAISPGAVTGVQAGAVSRGAVQATGVETGAVKVETAIKGIEAGAIKVAEKLDKLIHIQQTTSAPVTADTIERMNQAISSHMSEQTSKVEVQAKEIGELRQMVKTQILDKVELLHKDIQAGTINYGGAGWTMLTAVVIVCVFVAVPIVVGFLLIRRLAHWKNLLSLVTGAVKNTSPETQAQVKTSIEHATSNGGPFGVQHKRDLADFAKKAGTFAVKQILSRNV